MSRARRQGDRRHWSRATGSAAPAIEATPARTDLATRSSRLSAPQGHTAFLSVERTVARGLCHASDIPVFDGRHLYVLHAGTPAKRRRSAIRWLDGPHDWSGDYRRAIVSR